MKAGCTLRLRKNAPRFIVWHDKLGSEANLVECLSYEGKGNLVNHPPLGAGDFVVIEDSDQNMKWKVSK